jgi:hypothetical protein
MSKVAESIPVSAKAARTNTPFFAKRGENFVSSTERDSPFFSQQNSAPAIQAKLNIGKPNDKYEQEADAVADNVVQRLSEHNHVKEKPITPANNIIPIQAKLNIGQPNDKYEKEAEAVADKVVQKLSEPNILSSQNVQNVKKKNCRKRKKRIPEKMPVNYSGRQNQLLCQIHRHRLMITIPIL